MVDEGRRLPMCFHSTLVTSLVAMLCGWGCSRASDATQHIDRSAKSSSNEVSELSAASRAPRAIVVSDDFVQKVSWEPGEKWVRIHNRELTPTGTWDRITYSFDTSYEVLAVSGRQADELYVAGRARTGQDVIEKWLVDTHTGGHFFAVQSVASPIGTPASAVPGTSSGIVGGGAYVPGANRLLLPAQDRVELYRGNGFGGVIDLSPDPEGRFLIVLSQSPRAIQRIPIQLAATPTVLYTSADISYLPYARLIHRRQHYVHGRVYIVGGNPTPQGVSLNVMLFDLDNDGDFESTQILSDAQYEAQGYTGQVWLTDFRHFTAN